MQGGILMRVIKSLVWVYYLTDTEPHFDKEKVGKWMYFFKDRHFVEKICKEAIEKNIVKECKHSNAEGGVSCFYLNDDDIEGHKRVIVRLEGVVSVATSYIPGSFLEKI